MEQILNEILHQLREHTRRFDSIDKEIGDVKDGLGNVESRLENVENRLENVENSIHRLEETVNNNATEFRNHFKQIETRLNQHEETFRVILNELTGTKIDKKYLSSKTGVHETEINQLKERAHV